MIFQYNKHAERRTTMRPLMVNISNKIYATKGGSYKDMLNALNRVAFNLSLMSIEKNKIAKTY